MDIYEKRRVCILVKAHPQPSQRYQETVCVAAVTEAHRLVRLYPIRFRQLSSDQRFTRFDWIEVEMTRAPDDPRPESYRVKEDTVRIVKRGEDMESHEKVRVWKPSVVESLEALKREQQDNQRSLGIVRPDPESVQFRYNPISQATDEERELSNLTYEQGFLFDEPLKPLRSAEYIFRYQFTSGGVQHSMQLHDWESQETYHQYKKIYGSPEQALAKMVDYYERQAPRMNLHLIMGNMKRSPWQFIIIGVLRTTADVEHADAQGSLL